MKNDIEILLKNNPEIKIHRHNKMMWYDKTTDKFVVYRLIVGSVYDGKDIEAAIKELIEI